VLAALAVLCLPGGPALAAGGAPAGPGASTASSALLGWGFNGNGEVGDGTFTTRLAPVGVRIPGGVTVTSVRSGCSDSFALTSTGQVFAWGGNAEGQLGDGTTTDRPRPVQVHIPPGVTITAVRNGCFFALALTSTGQVLAWGGNPNGELGNGTTTNSDVPEPVSLPAGTTVTSIGAGESHGLALTSIGQVWAWGDNEFGQLGDGSTTSSDTPVQAQIPSNVTLTDIAAGGLDTLALTSTGQVLAWGDNAQGQLGDGTTTVRLTPVPVALPGGVTVRGVIGSCTHTLARTSTGRVLAWGANIDGQLGIGTTTGSPKPVYAHVPKGTRVAGIGGGCQFSLARTAAGQVLAWGDGSNGALGIGIPVLQRNSPVRVKLPTGVAATAVGAGPEAEAAFAIVRPAP
jgi:hypothetical protein